MIKNLLIAASFICLVGCTPQNNQPASPMTAEPTTQAVPAAATSCDMNDHHDCGKHGDCGCKCSHDKKSCECDHKGCSKPGCMHDKDHCKKCASCSGKNGSCSGAGKKK